MTIVLYINHCERVFYSWGDGITMGVQWWEDGGGIYLSVGVFLTTT